MVNSKALSAVEDLEEETPKKRVFIFKQKRNFLLGTLLSPAQKKMYKLLASDMTKEDILNRLIIAESTFKTHCNKIFQKTGLKNRKMLQEYEYNRKLDKFEKNRAAA